MNDLSPAALDAFAVLRQADEDWLPLWQLAKRLCYGWPRASAAVRDLRRAGLVSVRHTSVGRGQGGLCRSEVSLSAGGVW